MALQPLGSEFSTNALNGSLLRSRSNSFIQSISAMHKLSALGGFSVFALAIFAREGAPANIRDVVEVKRARTRNVPKRTKTCKNV